VDKGANVNAKSAVGYNPLRWAACGGHTEVAEYLIGKGADVNARENNGQTPIMCAAACGYPETISLLLKHGADANAATDYGDTALIMAVKDLKRGKNKLDVISALVKGGASVTTANREGLTPVKAAVRKREQDVINLLKKAGGM